MTDSPAPLPDGYVPFGLDFDKLASEIRAFSGEGVLPETLRALVGDALRHVRDETAGLDGRVVGRVLMASGVLVQALEDSNPGWNGRMIANLLATLGQRLWDNADATPSDLTQHIDQGSASRWWAVWEPDHRLRAVEEFATPRLRGEVLQQLRTDGRPALSFDVEPITEAWARRLRYLLEFGAATGQPREAAVRGV